MRIFTLALRKIKVNPWFMLLLIVLLLSMIVSGNRLPQSFTSGTVSNSHGLHRRHLMNEIHQDGHSLTIPCAGKADCKGKLPHPYSFHLVPSGPNPIGNAKSANADDNLHAQRSPPFRP
ncbi:hypothetical protein O6H91_07G121800 [Diphasiastrum complanatum]|uniref:Uncharacterized protein n=2 Tax=Diphasiastrum complanatum TaxID=34168 RepID=A0ACC2D924_DIPCM|nr:hypothetical protein O6H91_07G120200 [Diphasiastrum complanatum]KAJ7550858.1 hypothetical protein O6H91_07G121800 [Diphasiastrum complanatum]